MRLPIATGILLGFTVHGVGEIDPPMLEPAELVGEPVDWHPDPPETVTSPSDEEPPEEPGLSEASLLLLKAAALGDPALLSAALADGANPNAEIPEEVPEFFLEQFPHGSMHYYVRREQGLTALMLAAQSGSPRCVQLLLEAGAERWAKTRRNRTFALQFAARQADVGAMRLLLGLPDQLQPGEPHVRVLLAEQTAIIYQDGQEILRSPISSGKPSKPTPPGDYVITNKYRNWNSTIYRVRMPFFLRFSTGTIGFHAGRLPGHPASSGCIRLPEKLARQFYEILPVGAVVVVE